jgi:hypothetical protein
MTYLNGVLTGFTVILFFFALGERAEESRPFS